MTDLDLRELDRLEQEATDGPWPVDCLTIKTIHRWLKRHGAQRANEDIALVSATRNQLRPLLDLVDGLARALDVLADYHNDATADDILADYRRAKGEK